jgi:hypothetical protein
VTMGQEDAASGDTLRLETMCQPLRSLLAAAIGIGIEGEIKGARALAQLLKLIGIEMDAQGTGEVVKAGLPQHGIVEQPLDKNHFGALPDLLPGIQATLGPGEESMGEGGTDTTAAEVDDVLALAQGKDDALIVSAMTSDSKAAKHSPEFPNQEQIGTLLDGDFPFLSGGRILPLFAFSVRRISRSFPRTTVPAERVRRGLRVLIL